jgi:hypothetical protein
MVSLEKEIDRNYNGLKHYEDIRDIIRCIESHDSIYTKDIIFIKQLTKSAQQCLEKANFNGKKEELLKKLYGFHGEGIIKSRELKDKIKNDKIKKNVKKMYSHFYSHAGDVAQDIFNINNNPRWAEEWYDAKLNAAKNALPEEKEFTTICYQEAGDAANWLMDNTEDKEVWAVRNVECIRNALNSIKDKNSIRYANMSMTYGIANEKAYSILKKRDFKKKSAKASKKSGEIILRKLKNGEISPTNQKLINLGAIAFHHAAYNSIHLYNKSNKISDLREAKRCSDKLVYLADQSLNPHPGNYELASDIYNAWHIRTQLKSAEKKSKRLLKKAGKDFAW